MKTEALDQLQKGVARSNSMFEKEIVRLEADFEQEKMALTQVGRSRREAVSIAEPEELTLLRRQSLLADIQIKEIAEERFWRNLFVNFWGYAAAAAGLLLFAFSWIPLPGSGPKKLSPLKGSVRRQREEKEISEQAWQMMSVQGSGNYEEACRALQQDEFRTCSYCAGALRIDELGEVAEVRYYKLRPHDVAEEKRIFLGTRFLAEAVGSRMCTNCGHTNRR